MDLAGSQAQSPGRRPAWAPSTPPALQLPVGRGSSRGRSEAACTHRPGRPPGSPGGPAADPVAVTVLQTGCSADITAVKYDFLYRLPGRFSRFPAAITATCVRLFCHVCTCGCARMCALRPGPAQGPQGLTQAWLAWTGPSTGSCWKRDGLSSGRLPLPQGWLSPSQAAHSLPNPVVFQTCGRRPWCPGAPRGHLGVGAAPHDCLQLARPPCWFHPRPGPGAPPGQKGAGPWASRGREDTQPHAAWLKQHSFVLAQEERWGHVSGWCSGTQGEQELSAHGPGAMPRVWGQRGDGV